MAWLEAHCPPEFGGDCYAFLSVVFDEDSGNLKHEWLEWLCHELGILSGGPNFARAFQTALAAHRAANAEAVFCTVAADSSELPPLRPLVAHHGSLRRSVSGEHAPVMVRSNSAEETDAELVRKLLGALFRNVLC